MKGEEVRVMGIEDFEMGRGQLCHQHWLILCAIS